MKNNIILKIFISTILTIYTFVAFPLVAYSETQGVKTSYKRYSIFKFKEQDVLCEPYLVNKDDWLYKIFRKKGEISERDFPHFIIIFKKINPKINNVDAINPGIQIMIPLKKVQNEEYDQTASGEVDIPVVEFSAMADDLNLKPFIQKHKIKKGDTISTLIDKDFLKKNGAISEEGLKAFTLANPDMKNIDFIYEGANINLPDPSIKSQPWFNSLLTKKVSGYETEESRFATKENKLEAHELAQLKKYSALIGGTLLNQGKMYFPNQNGTSQVLDLSSVPVIETKDGSKILIMAGDNVNAELLEYVQDYWKGLKTQLISETADKIKNIDQNKKVKTHSVTNEYKKIIEKLLNQTDYDYISDAKIPFTIHKIKLEAKFGKVILPETTDLLINFGNVYGLALKAIEEKEFKIFSITKKMSVLELATQLFSHIGYKTRQNPSFPSNGIIKTIHGLYAENNQEKLFIVLRPLNLDALDYLKKENIKILSVINQIKNDI